MDLDHGAYVHDLMKPPDVFTNNLNKSRIQFKILSKYIPSFGVKLLSMTLYVYK